MRLLNSLALLVLAVVLSSTSPARAQLCEPRLTSTLGGVPFGIEVRDNFAFVAAGPYGLQVFDITDAMTPVLVGSASTPSMARDVAIQGDFAFVAMDPDRVDLAPIQIAGLAVFDISDVSAPEIVTILQDGIGVARGIQVIDQTAYVNSAEGLKIVDVTNPRHPIIVGAYPHGNKRQSVGVRGNLAYVTEKGVLYVVDIADPVTPTTVTQVTLGWARGIVVDDSWAYVAAVRSSQSFPAVIALDLSNPVAPVEAGVVDVRIQGHLSDPPLMEIAGDQLYLSFRGRLAVLDISNPSSLAVQSLASGFAPDRSGRGADIAVVGDTVYQADPNVGLQIFTVATSSGPEFVRADLRPNETMAVFSHKDLAILSGAAPGMFLVDTHDVNAPSVAAIARDVARVSAVTDDLLYGHRALPELAIVAMDITDPLNPVRLSKEWLLPGLVIQVVEEDDILFVAQSKHLTKDPDRGWLSILDFTDPANPLVISHLETSSALYSIAKLGEMAYLATKSNQLLAADLSDRTNPVIAGSLALPSRIAGIAVHSSLVYAVGEQFHIIDVTDATHPVRIATMELSGADILVHNRLAIIAGWPAGIHILDLEDPRNPTLRTTIDTPGIARATVIHDGALLVADGPAGLHVIDLGGCVFSSCPTDLNDDGVIDGRDLSAFTSGWRNGDMGADINGDGRINGQDLGLLMQQWGPCLKKKPGRNR